MAAPATLMFVLSGSGMGGMERMTFELARSLDRARHRPVICCLKCPRDPAPRAGQPEHEGMLRGKYDLGVIPRLRRVMRAERPDVVFALGSGDAAFWGRLAARLSGVRRVAWWLHSMRDDIGRLNLALVPWTDVVIALSPRHRAFLIDRYGLPASKVTIVPNGIDWTAMAESAPRSEVRDSLGIGARDWVVGAVGGLRPVKGYEVLLAAAARLFARRLDCRLVIVGDGEMRGQLEGLARRLGIAPRVTFLGARRDVPRLLAAFDAFAVSSHSEAFPLSVLEAMAAGLPVVATDAGCVPDIVRPGATGLLIPPRRPDLLAMALESLHDDPARAREMGRQGRELVRSDYSLDGSAAALGALADRLISTDGALALDSRQA